MGESSQQGPGHHWPFPSREPNTPFSALVHLGQVFCHLPLECPCHKASTPWDWSGLGAKLGHKCPPPSLQIRAVMRAYDGTESESETLAQSCLTPCDSTDGIVHGILQARILEWVAIPFSRGSSQPRACTQVSRIAGRFFTV